MSAILLQIRPGVHHSTRLSVFECLIKRGMQLRSLLRIKAIIFNGKQIDFCTLGQIRWLVELESAVLHAGSKGLHAAKDIASRVTMPVVGAATQTRPGLGGSREGPKPGLGRDAWGWVGLRSSTPPA